MAWDAGATFFSGVNALEDGHVVGALLLPDDNTKDTGPGESRTSAVPNLLLPAAVVESSAEASPTSQIFRAPPTGAVAATAPARWQLPPFRLWGDLAYDYRLTRIEGGSDFVSHSVVANFNASTYIYAPWIAILTAGVGLTASRLNDGELAGSDKFITGYVNLNVFPSSRFPFEARFYRSDRGFDNDFGSDQNYRQTRLGVSQRYRSEDGRDQYAASFDRFIQDGTAVGKDIQDALQLDFNTRFRRANELQLLGTWNHNRRVSTDELTDYETVLARHSYRPDSTLSWENSANITHTASRFKFGESDLRIFQLNSFAFWRPESQPLTVNSSFRLFSLESGKGQNTIDTRSVNASAGANYTVSKNLRAFGGVSITDIDVGGQHNRPSATTLGASYQGDSIELKKLRYDWFVGGTGLYSTGDADHDGFSFNGMLGQSINSSFLLDNGSAITFNAAQNLSAIAGANVEGSKQLFHSASISWNSVDPQSSASSFIRLSATESRYLDGQHEKLQLVNLQLTRALDLGRDRALSGSLTVQQTRRFSQRKGFENSLNVGKPETTASADLIYRHQNIFGVPRLIYSSQLRLNRQELVQALGAPSERELRSWENRLDYSIGRLESRLLLRIADIDGVQHWLIMFRIMRRF